MAEQNPRQLKLCEEIMREIMPLVLTKATLRQPKPENNVRKMHYRGPMGIQLILTANHGEETGRSFIELRRGKEWLIVFSCLPCKKKFGILGTDYFTTGEGDSLEHNRARPCNLPFWEASSANLAHKRGEVGRGKILPTYINLAYWMIDFGEIAFIDYVLNIDAIERDVIALMVERR